jgi:hypothetical protein
MTNIQISDLNVSDFEFMHQLTDEELLAINGGWGWKVWKKIIGGAAIATGVVLAATGVGTPAVVPLIAGGASLVDG